MLNTMIIQPRQIYYAFFKIASVLFLVFSTFLNSKISYSQCTTPAVGPATPTGGAFRPTCIGGSNGRVRISGINSASGTNINATYSVRRLTAIGGTPITIYPVTLGQTQIDIPGFSAGTYFFDVIDQCGNSSADISVTILNPAAFPTAITTIVFKDNLTNLTCGDIIQLNSVLSLPSVDDTYLMTYTNHLGATITTPVVSVQAINTGGNTSFTFTTNVPLTFFDSQSITAVLSSSCGSTAPYSLPFPGSTFVIHKYANPATPTELPDVQVSSGCLKGYQISRQRWNGVAPISVVIEETANLGSTPTGFDGSLLAPYSGSIYYKPSPPSVSQNGNTSFITLVPATGGLKYNVNYTITYTDACGRIYTENVFRADPTPTLTTSCVPFANGAVFNPFLDDVLYLRINSSTGNFNFLSNPVLTALSGPATYTTQSGGVSTTHNITYPFEVDYTITPSGGSNFSMYFQLPPGTYQVNVTDDCGYNNTLTVGSSCSARNTVPTHTLNYCAAATPGNANLTISAGPQDVFGRWRIYNSSNSVLYSGSGQTSLTSTKPNLAPGTYYLRYGGVLLENANNPTTMIEPSFVDPSTPLPRYFDNFIYEYEIVIPPLLPLSFQGISACNTTISMLGLGGVEPYQYSLYDAAGVTLLQGPQASGIFSGLTYGATYSGNVKDACGSEFNQVFTVYSPSTPITSIDGPNTSICPNSNTTLSAIGGVTGFGANIYWYSGPNGTGNYIGSGSTIVVSPISTTTYYARREGNCNVTPDAFFTLNVKSYIYAPDATITSDYCTDNDGWHHFYVGDHIVLSCLGDFSGFQFGFPFAMINKSTAFYQSGLGPNSPLDCLNFLPTGEERFEMRRSWNIKVGESTLLPPYKIRFYYEPYEKLEVENAAVTWINNYSGCGYTFKYQTPNGFYWFKNNSGDYVPAQYDGLHLNGIGGNTADGVNYIELSNIASFSGGSGSIIVEPSIILDDELLSFEATCVKSNRLTSLKWQTAFENNTSYFTIYKSFNGTDWTHIGKVNASANSQSVVDYFFVDTNFQNSIAYYKLVEIDLDGVKKELGLISSDCSQNESDFFVFPNPSNDYATVVIPESFNSEKINLIIRNIEGRIITCNNFSFVSDNKIKIDLNSLTNGVYFLVLDNGQNLSKSIKIIIN